MKPNLSQAAMKAIAAFLPIMEDPEFRFTDGSDPVTTQPDGTVVFQGICYNGEVHNLVFTAEQCGWVYSDDDFRWPEWSETQEARELRGDPAALAQATPEQLAKLMTIFARQERFCDGAMEGWWESGLLLRLLRRADALVHEHERMEA